MKQKLVYVCNNCGNKTGKWMGKCLSCGEWNTITEEVEVAESTSSKHPKTFGELSKPLKFSEIELTDEHRLSSGIGELDRVLGGGIVAGSLVLVGGDPGIGKSTLLLQLCKTLKDTPILYASGEESQKQIKIRAERLGVKDDNALIYSENNIQSILNSADKIKPSVLIIDSVQTIYSSDIPSTPGSVGQVREVTMSLMRYAKETGTTVFLVGHVTKDGAIAGPKVLEHMVDCVLYFEGERNQYHRILRSVKNRFGSDNEIGVFEMSDKGLLEVKNPSKMLLSGRPENTSGSCVVCSVEGSRPILAEVQALVSPTTFNYPKREANGISVSRLQMLLAVLEKRVGLQLSGTDVFVNVIGGIKLDEPAVDLGVCVALGSSFKNLVCSHDCLAIGEVGLTGELRQVSNMDARIAEASKIGFKTVVIPKGNISVKPKNIEVIEVTNLKDALNSLF